MKKFHKSISAKSIFQNSLLITKYNKREIENKNTIDSNFEDNQRITENISGIICNKKHYIKDSFDDYSLKLNESLSQYYGVDENKILKNHKIKSELKLKKLNLPAKDRLNIKIFQKQNKLKNKESKITIRILEKDKSYKNPLDSLIIIRKNNLIFDEISKLNYERQADSIDESINNYEKMYMKYKIPKIKINGEKESLSKEKEIIFKQKNLISLIENNEIKEIKFYCFFKYSNKNFPEGREQFSICLKDNNELLLFGGITSVFNLNYIWNLNLESLEWKKIKNNENNYIRYGHNLFYYNNILFIYGGKIKYLNSEEICDFDIYKFNNNKWLNLKIEGNNKPYSRKNFIGELIGNNYIIHGGIIFTGEIISDVYILNIGEKYYWNKPIYNNKYNGPLIYGHSSCLVVPHEIKNLKQINIYDFPKIKNSKIKTNGIYIFGGKYKDEGLSNDLYILIFGKNYLEWKKINTIGKKPLPRFFHSMNYYEKENFIIIHGGRNDIKSESFALNDTYILALNKMIWFEIKLYSFKTDFKIINRCGHVSFIYDDKLIIFGGMNCNNYIGSSLFIVNLNHKYFPFKNQNSYIRKKLLNNYIKFKKEDPGIFQRYSYVFNKKQLDILPEYDLPLIK